MINRFINFAAPAEVIPALLVSVAAAPVALLPAILSALLA